MLELKAMTTFASVTSVELAVAEYLEKGLYERHLLRLNRALREQVDAMRAAVAQLEKANTQTTTEIADALTTTAPERADCVFPPDVVRGLQGARDRAAEAAASGIRGALPGAPASPARAASGPGSP